MSTTATAERTSTLTAMQEQFVEAYLSNGGNARKAAEDAGYAASVCKTATREILGSASVMRAVNEGLAAMQQAAHKRLAIGVERMLTTLEEIAEDPTIAAGVRVQAANSWLDRASFQRGTTDGDAADELATQDLEDILANL